MAEYDGSIELISGITQKNGGTFPLVDASAVQIDESGTRLNGWIKTLNASALVLGENDMWSPGSEQSQTPVYEASPLRFSPSTAYIIKTTCENTNAEIIISYLYSIEWYNEHPNANIESQVIKDTGAGLQDKAFITRSLSEGVTNIAKIYAKGFTEEEILNTNIVPYNTTFSVAESGYTIASGENSHTEGRGTKALALFSHAEGSGTVAGSSATLGNSAHAEGGNTSATGNYSHAEGQYSLAIGAKSHAEGNSTIANGNGAHAEGCGTLTTKVINNTTYTGSGAYGNYSHSEGSGTWAIGGHSHAEGSSSTSSGSYSHAEGYNTTASGDKSHAEGQDVVAAGIVSHAEGYGMTDATKTVNSTTYTGSGAHGAYSHSEGMYTFAIGNTSHAEGYSTLSIGKYSHAEGKSTTAQGLQSHAEGTETTSEGANAHAEGENTLAQGDNSHAEGSYATASGIDSHAEGYKTSASRAYQHVFGAYNVADNVGNSGASKGDYIEIVGNGTSNSARSNARTLKWNGDEWLAGTLTVGKAPTNNMDVATKQYVDNAMSVNDAMVFKGTIGSSGATVSSLPATHKAGWAYKVATAGTYAGVTCEIGDLIICAADGTSANNADWTVVQNNIEPDVYAVKNNPVFTGSISMGRKSSSTVGGNSVATGYNAEATGDNSFATGYKARATAIGANAAGLNTIAANQYAHVEGRGDTGATQTVDDMTYTGSGAYGKYSHAEGSFTWAIGEDSHAEGTGAVATGDHSHAEGMGAQASGSAAHAEGGGIASGADSHAEGVATASGNYSHAENGGTASGHYSHAEGLNTIANHASQHVFGTYNVADPSTKASNLKGTYVEIVGKGTGDNDRSNARTLDWDGNERIAGRLTVGAGPTGAMHVATKGYVDSEISDVNAAIVNSGAVLIDFGTMPVTAITNSEYAANGIDAYYKAIAIELGDPTAVPTPISISTDTNLIRLTATFTKSTTLQVVLIKCTRTINLGSSAAEGENPGGSGTTETAGDETGGNTGTEPSDVPVEEEVAEETP